MSIMAQTMLWMVRYAVVEVQAEERASKMTEPSRRDSSEPPTSLRTNSPARKQRVEVKITRPLR